MSALAVLPLALLLALALPPALPKVYSGRCKLAEDLVRPRVIDNSYIRSWICIIENVSGRNTSKLEQRPNRSANYGIFQINSRKWCRPGKKGGDCNIPCESLLDDDITDDTICAQKIFETEGFKAWSIYQTRCMDLARLAGLLDNCPDFYRKLSSDRFSPPRLHQG